MKNGLALMCLGFFGGRYVKKEVKKTKKSTKAWFKTHKVAGTIITLASAVVIMSVKFIIDVVRSRRGA